MTLYLTLCVTLCKGHRPSYVMLYFRETIIPVWLSNDLAKQNLIKSGLKDLFSVCSTLTAERQLTTFIVTCSNGQFHILVL